MAWTVVHGSRIRARPTRALSRDADDLGDTNPYAAPIIRPLRHRQLQVDIPARRLLHLRFVLPARVLFPHRSLPHRRPRVRAQELHDRPHQPLVQVHARQLAHLDPQRRVARHDRPDELLGLEFHLRVIHHPEDVLRSVGDGQLWVLAELDGDCGGNRQGVERHGGAAVGGLDFPFAGDVDVLCRGQGREGDRPAPRLRQEGSFRGDGSEGEDAATLIECDGRDSPVDVLDPVAVAVVFVHLKGSISSDNDFYLQHLWILPAIAGCFGGIERDDRTLVGKNRVLFQPSVEPFLAVAVIDDTGEYIHAAAWW